MTEQRVWADVAVGDRITPSSYPIPVHRLVVAASVTRDFNPLHHNDAVAQSAGADAMFAGAILLQGMWERTLRDWIGLDGTIRALRDFRMRRLTLVGTTAHVEGVVVGKDRVDGEHRVSIEIWTSVDGDVTVGPGLAVVTLP